MGRRVFGAVLVLFAVMAALTTPASAQEPGEVGTLGATQCKSAPGPGDWNTGCIAVIGHSLQVDRIEVTLSGTVAPYFPADVCNVKFVVWGALYPSGQHWQQEFTNPNCGRGSLGAWFYPGTRFKDGSYLCARTIHAEGTQEPNCIIIKG